MFMITVTPLIIPKLKFEIPKEIMMINKMV
jgi:hypothetical protein